MRARMIYAHPVAAQALMLLHALLLALKAQRVYSEEQAICCYGVISPRQLLVMYEAAAAGHAAERIRNKKKKEMHANIQKIFLPAKEPYMLEHMRARATAKRAQLQGIHHPPDSTPPLINHADMTIHIIS